MFVPTDSNQWQVNMGFGKGLDEEPLPELMTWHYRYCQTYNISCALAGNKIADHSDVVGASPVSAAPTSFLT